MGGVTVDVISAAKAWADAREALLEAKVKRNDAPLCDGKYPYGDRFIICRIAGRFPWQGSPPWCAACEAWNDAQLNVEKAQRQLKKAEKALIAVIRVECA